MGQGKGRDIGGDQSWEGGDLLRQQSSFQGCFPHLALLRFAEFSSGRVSCDGVRSQRVRDASCSLAGEGCLLVDIMTDSPRIRVAGAERRSAVRR